MNSPVVLVTILMVCIAGVLTAQSEDELSSEDQDKVVLMEAIKTLDKKESFVLTGSITEKEGESKDGLISQMIVVGGGGSGSGSPFEGMIEIWRTGRGELVITSKEALPGVAYFSDGDRAVTEILYEDASVDTTQVISDLSGFLDLEGLQRIVAKTTFEKTEGAEEGETIYRGDLPERIVKRGKGSPYDALMAPQVLALEGEIILAPDGSLIRFRFIVIRSDPFAKLKQQALEGEMDGGINLTMGGLEHSDEEGKRTIYTLEVSSARPSTRAKAFLKRIREVLKNQVF